MSKEFDLYIIHGWAYTVEPWEKALKLLDEAGVKVKMLHVPGLTEPSQKTYTIRDYMRGRMSRFQMVRLHWGIRMEEGFY